MNEIEFSEISEDGEYISIWKNDIHYSFLVEEVLENMLDIEKLRMELKELKEKAKQAQMQLQSTQLNWREECLFECNDILESIVKPES